ncbi:MAG: bile acid:sodium symporter family protein [Chlorobi bacterium]|nr:bile acid:sodium symporter family protein [Chlorobiota bacterium]
MYETLSNLDHIRLNFSQESLHALNIAIGFLMFGVALEIKIQQFKDVINSPKSAIIGFVSQFLVLPLLTFLIVIALRGIITPTMALGMILVAACPGGNFSNFISSLAKANVALSVSLTAIATVSAVILTPLNFSLWGNWAINIYSHANPDLVRPLEIDVYQMFKTVFIILGLPLIFGLTIGNKFPAFTKKIVRRIKQISLIVFTTVIVLALMKNSEHLVNYLKYVFVLVLIHNALALGSGYLLGKIFNRPLADRKTLSIETGIQNAGLALVLIFNPKIFPPEMELGGMAIVAAWWGIWHMLAGLLLAGYWTNFTFGLSRKAKAAG